MVLVKRKRVKGISLETVDCYIQKTGILKRIVRTAVRTRNHWSLRLRWGYARDQL